MDRHKNALNRWIVFLSLTATLFSVALVITAATELSPEWHRHFSQRNPAYEGSPEIKQVFLSSINHADRCITCHLPSDVKASNKFHAVHSYSRFACTTCHFGNGRSLNFNEAHLVGKAGKDAAVANLRLSAKASCTICHSQRFIQSEDSGPDQGRILAARLGCAECHTIPRLFLPTERLDLISLVSKLRKPYLLHLLKQSVPSSTITRSMPYFAFTDVEAAGLFEYLEGLQAYREVPLFPPSMTVFKPGENVRGMKEFEKLGCQRCHVTANFSGGGDSGPALTNLGHRFNKRWLVWWLSAPRELRYWSEMPVYTLKPESIRLIVAYLMSVAGRDPYAYKKSAKGNAEEGLALFEANHCLACHTTDGTSIESKIGPPLAGLASRNECNIPFRDIPENALDGYSVRERLDKYLGFVHSFESIVHRNIAMPNFRLAEREREPLVNFLLSLRAFEATGDLLSLTPYRKAVTRGEILFSRRLCGECHSIEPLPEGLSRAQGREQFKRLQGPNLSRIGEKVRSGWLEDWLGQPEAVLRGTRMPNPKLSPDEISSLAAFLRSRKGGRLWRLSTRLPSKTRESALAGEGIFISKGCFKCHLIDGRGVAMGPDLSNVGPKITPQFIVPWLHRAGDLQPDTEMDDIGLTPSEALLVFRFLETLRNRR